MTALVPATPKPPFVIFTAPATSSFDPGFVVPIPKFPVVAAILAASAPFVWKMSGPWTLGPIDMPLVSSSLMLFTLTIFLVLEPVGVAPPRSRDAADTCPLLLAAKAVWALEFVSRRDMVEAVSAPWMVKRLAGEAVLTPTLVPLSKMSELA